MTKIHPAAIKKLISYYYLLSFCPPDFVGELKQASQTMRSRYDLNTEAVLEIGIPEAAMRIVAFQQATRQPEEFAVQELAEVMVEADQNAEKLASFQEIMREIALHPGRAKAANRLHRQKGCAFCTAPCQYAFFTLISEPDFKLLKEMLDAENKQIAQQRNPIKALWSYTGAHLCRVLGLRAGYIEASHLGNLSYCLLMLGTAKSRFAMKEKELKVYQKMNQETIERLRHRPIEL